jgi:archaellum component FlaC
MKDLWDVANEIESLSYRIENIRDVVELIATDLQDPQSGATWAVRDALEVIADTLQLRVTELMEIYRESKKIELPKKGKKK